MLKDIVGIEIQGGNFETVSDVLLFNPHDEKNNKNKKVKGTLVYGRNGAGKSTLAKSVKKAKGDIQDDINQAAFLDITNKPIVLSDEEKDCIFVFDEEYVDKNIKLRESGLNTIIMLGKQAEIENQLKNAYKCLDIAKADYESQNSVTQEYEDSGNEKSPRYYIKKMRLALQGDDCWSGRDKIIKEKRQNSTVKEDTYKQFLNIQTTMTRDQLVVEFNNTFKELQTLKQGDASISTKVPGFSIKYDEEGISRLLKIRIEKPELSEREQYLLKLVQTGETTKLNYMLTVFSNKDVCVCPTCMQNVSEVYKQDLIRSIQKVLSKVVEEHQNELRKYIMQKIEIDFSPFSKLSEDVEVCIQLLIQINEAIEKNNLIIQSKIDDPYTPCERKIESVSVLLLQLEEALEKLEFQRVAYNKKITDTTPIIKKLTKINDEIAYWDIRDYYRQYCAAQEKAKVEQDKLNEKQRIYTYAKFKVEELVAEQKNVKVAISIINSNLRYIFFSNDRFVIDYRDDKYVLLSNGKAVNASQISQGERNIIGLCYFFASILQNQEEEKAYDKEYLIMIDDPVSSFDIENKTGIMSFLRYQIGKFMLGNEYSRIIIMTHDLLTYYDADKIFEELIDASNVKFGGEKRIYRRYELKQKKLIQFSYNGRHEYTELVKIVYEFALGNEDQYELIIGNIMRQMLEAFSTFLYKKGIDKVSTDSKILDGLPEKEYKNYFENLMYRLILNNGSHRSDQTKAMEDLNFFAVISPDEKKRTAKEILCFIYLLNQKHLLAHLEGCRDVEENLKKWCEEIKNRVGA